MPAASSLKIKAALKIQRTVPEVFDAIVDPEKMSNYFISKGSGRMEDGKTIIWRFPEFDMEFPIEVLKVIRDESIKYSWSDPEENTTIVEMILKPVGNNETFVTITEGNRENDEAGILWLQRNTEGWANFLACLKAYLEYGINLRKGAFDISQMAEKESREKAISNKV
jgi:uncharacterized protein YndB with AHSA1/START domain